MECYKKFKKEHPEYKKLTFEQFKKVIRTYNTMIMEYVLETGKEFKLPFGFGTLTINKKKQTVFFEKDGKKRIILAVDWKTTKQLWKDDPESAQIKKLVYLTNPHSEGYRFKWIWFPKSARFTMSELWTFQPSRKSSRTLAQKLKDSSRSTFYQSLYQEHLVKQSDKY